LESKAKKIAVIGSSSMVGSRFCELQKDFELIKADLHGDAKVDITSKSSVKDFFSKNHFEYAILFSAYTDVDGAQKDKGNKDGPAWKINVDGVKNVAEFCKKNKIKLIFISTDFVFDGKNGPYSEESGRAKNIENISWYGVTKIKGEEIVERQSSANLIVRISYPYRSKFDTKIDFARSILKKYDEGTLYSMFNDQYITPTYIDDIAPTIELLISKGSTGIYHVASPESVTPHEFTEFLLTKFNKKKVKVETASIMDFLNKEGATPRPINAGLKTDKITSLGFIPTGWRQGIEKIYLEITGN